MAPSRVVGCLRRAGAGSVVKRRALPRPGHFEALDGAGAQLALAEVRPRALSITGEIDV